MILTQWSTGLRYLLSLLLKCIAASYVILITVKCIAGMIPNEMQILAITLEFKYMCVPAHA